MTTLSHRALLICSSNRLQVELDEIQSILAADVYPSFILTSTFTKKARQFRWNCLGLNLNEMKEVVEDRDVWSLNLKLVPPRPSRKSGVMKNENKKRRPDKSTSHLNMGRENTGLPLSSKAGEYFGKSQQQILRPFRVALLLQHVFIIQKDLCYL